MWGEDDEALTELPDVFITKWSCTKVILAKTFWHERCSRNGAKISKKGHIVLLF